MWIQLSFSTTLICFTSSLNLQKGGKWELQLQKIPEGIPGRNSCLPLPSSESTTTPIQNCWQIRLSKSQCKLRARFGGYYKTSQLAKCKVLCGTFSHQSLQLVCFQTPPRPRPRPVRQAAGNLHLQPPVLSLALHVKKAPEPAKQLLVSACTQSGLRRRAGSCR